MQRSEMRNLISFRRFLLKNSINKQSGDFYSFVVEMTCLIEFYFKYFWPEFACYKKAFTNIVIRNAV
jgi:hypothetical protein